MKTFERVMQLTRTVSSIVLLQDEEAKALYDAVSAVPQNGLVVEIGCNLGRSSSLIAQMAHDQNFRTVYVDPYKEQPELMVGWARMMREIGGEDWHRFTLLCMRTEQARWELERLCVDGIDVAYIDGDHEGPGVKLDLEIVADMVKPGGFMCCHDYGPEVLEPGGKPMFRFPDVTRLLDAYTAEGWDRVEVAHTMGVWRKA